MYIYIERERYTYIRFVIVIIVPILMIVMIIMHTYVCKHAIRGAVLAGGECFRPLSLRVH